MEIVADSWIKLQKKKLKLVVLNVYLALPLMVMSIRIRAALFSELAENPVTNTPFLPFLDLIPYTVASSSGLLSPSYRYIC